jgi:hypothetical protein
MTIVIANTTVHMLRRSGHFRSEMVPAITSFVRFLQCVGEADDLRRIGSPSDAFVCRLCCFQTVEVGEGLAELCCRCPLCDIAHHDRCVDVRLGDRLHTSTLIDAISDHCGQSRGDRTLGDVVQQSLCKVLAGPLARLRINPDAFCTLCSKVATIVAT